MVTTTYITRNHGFAVWDTLFGLDERAMPHPQMAEGIAVEEEGRRVTITLRPGLRFHDGLPVLARDAVASIRRWAGRDPLGQTLLSRLDALEAPDDRHIVFRLNRPFGALVQALAKTSPPVCFIKPERLAQTDAARPITEVVGSGPYRYLPDQRVSGARVAYARFDGYVPREGGTPSGTAGPKRAFFERVEWRVIPDAATAAAAMQANEADWWEFPTPDLLPLLRRRADLAIENPDSFGFLALLRFNHLHPPFDRPAMRQAVAMAVDQAGFMAAAAGTEASMGRTGVGFFLPSAAMASTMAPATPDVAAARRALAAAGYAGERITLIGPTNYPNVQALTEVAADMLRRIGINLDYAPSDWATVVQRRGNRAPPAQGGWNILCSFFSGLDFLDPGVHLMLRGNGVAAWPGWPTAPAIEALREEWLDTPGLPERQTLATRISAEARTALPYVPLGQFFQPTAFRRELTGRLNGATLFWNIRRE